MMINHKISTLRMSLVVLGLLSNGRTKGALEQLDEDTTMKVPAGKQAAA